MIITTLLFLHHIFNIKSTHINTIRYVYKKSYLIYIHTFYKSGFRFSKKKWTFYFKFKF